MFVGEARWAHSFLRRLPAVGLSAVLGSALLLGGQAARPPAAEAVLGAEFVISAKDDQQQRTLGATWHAVTGQFLVVWSEHPDHTTGATEVHNGDDQIRGRLVNLDSSLAGGTDFLISSGGSSKDFPQVAHVINTNNPAQQDSLVVWSDRRDGGDDIWGQLVAPAGNTLQGANFKISGGDDDLFPSLAYGQIDASNGRFLVAWERVTGDGESEVWGRLVRGATSTGGQNPGDLIAPAFQISDSAGGRAVSPSIAFDPVNDQFLVSWADDRGGDALEREVWAGIVSSNGAVVDANGGATGNSFVVSNAAGFEYAPTTRYHPEQQEYLVVWNRQPSEFANDDVYARRVSPAGALLGSQISVAVTGGQEEHGDIAIDASTGHYVIPLTTGPTLTNRNQVEIQKLAMTGTLVGAREQVATDMTANKGPTAAVYGSTQVGPGAGLSAVSEVLVAWRDARSNVDPEGLLSQDIYGRMVEVQNDTDGDGLLDSWETNGYVDINADGILNAGDLDFNLFPAANRPDVNHKDLYVEVDWMQVDADNDGVVTGDPDQPGDHTHAPVAVAGSLPTGTTLDTVIAAFAIAPGVTNPDGTGGIRLHVDVGQMGGGGAIAETVGVDFFTGFETVKAANFATNRARVFRYSLFKHEGGGRGEIWGNDFWVGGGSNTQVLQAVTFMHEGGHTLGLRHGGIDNQNCKPNYFSIMSYTHSNTGIPPTLRLDYSSQTLPTLNEASLNEGVTLGDGADQTMFSTPGGAVGPGANTAGNVNIDWDNDGTGGETGAAVGNNDINNLAVCAPTGTNEILVGFNDWAAIRYNFLSSGQFDDNIHSFHADDDVTDASKDFVRDRYGDPAMTMSKTGTTAGIPGDPVSYTVEIDNAGTGLARNVVITDTWPAGLTFTGADLTPDLNVLNGDGSRTLVFPAQIVEEGGELLVTLNGTIDFPPFADEVTNTATMTAQNALGEPEPAITDSVVTDIQFPEMEVAKTATTAVNAGESVGYTITYENVGDADAAEVVVTDTLPAEVYYSIALDTGPGPVPDDVVANADGTTTLTWNVGAVPATSGPLTIGYSVRPGLLVLADTSLANNVSLDFSDANGNDYPAVSASATTTITEVTPTGNPQGLGYWRNHPELWTAETLARIQATDDRFDGQDGSTADGVLSSDEVAAVLVPGGNMNKVLDEQLLATYFNLATRRINASTEISSRTADGLGLSNVREAALYAIATLELPVDATNRPRYSDATRGVEEINQNRSEVY
ncbi:MAG TPA: hypothetical protein VGQ58_05275 [Candidatus Limnocylindrales bacterium]|jgi:uncharacterized repeat protein (TIGR01451 family)|nr:hypothetical protein [Candidatus Limnocylindrales bacterium]